MQASSLVRPSLSRALSSCCSQLSTLCCWSLVASLASPLSSSSLWLLQTSINSLWCVIPSASGEQSTVEEFRLRSFHSQKNRGASPISTTARIRKEKNNSSRHYSSKCTLSASEKAKRLETSCARQLPVRGDSLTHRDQPCASATPLLVSLDTPGHLLLIFLVGSELEKVF